MTEPLTGQIQAFSLPWPPSDLSPNFSGKRRDFLHAKKQYKHDCWATLLDLKVRKMTDERINVEYTFYPPGNHGYDDDNLLGRMKYGRDEIARRIGVDDNIFRTSEPVIMPSQGKPGRVAVTLRPAVVNVPIIGTAYPDKVAWK